MEESFNGCLQVVDLVFWNKNKKLALYLTSPYMPK